jgi:hypothetical protein
MTELEAISFATLHFDGEAHEWWYHGLVTLGHNHITSYLEFTERLMERFDMRDPKQCCICCVRESVGEGLECNFSTTSAENVGISWKMSQDLKKIQKH